MKGFSSYSINANGKIIDLSEPITMGILNATPDSFYAGSRKQTEYEISKRADQIISEGGKIIDIGAFSTRPNAAKVTAEEEMSRMRFALKTVRAVQPEAVLSIDTFRPEIAQMAVEEFGAGIINDVSEGNINGAFGGTSATPIPATGLMAEQQEDEMRKDEGDNMSAYPAIFRMAARLSVPYILMSTKPDIETMMKAFAKEVQQLRDLGVKDIIIDPGFGFGKTLDQNYQILCNLGKLRELDLPLLVGASRKSMIFRLFGTDADHSLNGTTVINTISMLLAGASILRVHDVKECVEATEIVKKTLSANV